MPIDSDLRPGRASIRYIEGDEYGLQTFADAVQKLKSDGNADRLELIVLHGQVAKPDFQRELIEALEQHAAREFAEAKDSAGNMHNPKLVALNTVLDDVVLKTPTVAGINADLATIGRRVNDASHEKLMLLRVDGRLKVLFFLYLVVEEA